VTKKQHDKEVARARSKRRTSVQQRRERRNRAIVLTMVVLMAFSLIGGAVLSLARDPAAPPTRDPTEAPVGDTESPTEDPATDDPAIDATEGLGDEEAVGPCGPTPDDVPEITSASYDEPFDLTIDTDATYVATFETTCGDIVVELDAAASPLTVNNLVNLAEEGFYDGIVFHRVIEGFMIQGGDPTGTGMSGPGYTFEDELDAARADGYPAGTVAMANAGPDTNGSQFFIVHQDAGLPPDYSVFGTVVEGMDVVDDIASSPTDPADRPLEDVAIRTITIDRS
jgi:cyclophilin family peptidyl-prolyl cis-trans isomerase